MSYTRKRHSGLGDVASIMTQLANGVNTAVDVSNDPSLPEAICRVQQLVAVENKRPVPACASTSSNLHGGVGLRRVMPALRAYVYAQQHPWVYPVAGVVAIGVPVLIGYLLGRGSRR